MRKSVKSVKSAKVEKVVAKRGRKPAEKKVEKKVEKKAPAMIEVLKSNLIVKSTQSLTGKIKQGKGFVSVDGKILPLASVLAIVNNTVFYTKSTVIGAIESVEEKNGFLVYTMENGVTVTVVDDSAVVTQIETVKTPSDEPEDSEDDSDDEEEEEEEEEEDDEESDDDEEEDDSEDSDEEDESDEEDDDDDEDDEEEDDDDDSFNL